MSIAEISGKIYKGKSVWRYELLEHGHTFCADYTEDVVPGPDGRWAGHGGSVPSWGAYDRGARRCAILILDVALGGHDATTDGALRRIDRVIRKHYKQFAKEVVAHLPDEWEISKQEVLDWVKKQGKKRKRRKK